MNTNFDNLKTTYDTAREAYNTANEAELDRQGDFIRNIMDTPVEVPSRPCKPTQPPAYTGANLQWTNTLTTIQDPSNTAMRMAGQGAPIQSAVGDSS